MTESTVIAPASEIPASLADLVSELLSPQPTAEDRASELAGDEFDRAVDADPREHEEQALDGG